MQRLQDQIRFLEQETGLRLNDLRREFNRVRGAESQKEALERYWAMVRKHHINKRFAKEVENEMDGQQYKNYPQTVKAMQDRWDDYPKEHRDDFGDDFIERSVNDIFLDLIRQQQKSKAKKKPKKKPKRRNNKDDAALRDRINRRRGKGKKKGKK